MRTPTRRRGLTRPHAHAHARSTSTRKTRASDYIAGAGRSRAPLTLVSRPGRHAGAPSPRSCTRSPSSTRALPSAPGIPQQVQPQMRRGAHTCAAPLQTPSALRLRTLAPPHATQMRGCDHPRPAPRSRASHVAAAALLRPELRGRWPRARHAARPRRRPHALDDATHATPCRTHASPVTKESAPS